MNTNATQLPPFCADKYVEGFRLPLYIQPMHSQVNPMQEEKDQLCVAMEDVQKELNLKVQQQQEQDPQLEVETNIYWHKEIFLQRFPSSSVYAYWTPQARSIIITAKASQLQLNDNAVTIINNAFDNTSKLVGTTRWNEGKNMHRMKQIIALPKYVCAKDVQLLLDNGKNVLILVAHRVMKPEKAGQVLPAFPELEKDCIIQGHEEEMHKQCQPTKIIIKNFLHQTPIEAVKYITESEEFFRVSCYVRECVKAITKNTFPGLMKTPRFVKDEKTQQWHLRIQFRLRCLCITRPEDVKVLVTDEQKRNIAVEVKREIRDNNSIQRLQIAEIRREFCLPDFIEINKMKFNFEMKEGMLCIDFPILREKVIAKLHQ